MMLEILVCGFLVIGSLFALIGAIGLARLPDFVMRLQAPTKAATIGVGSLLVASMLHFGAREGSGVHELLITLFLLLTAPVSANLMGRAALHLGVELRVSPPEDKDSS
jgi:multicomponent K+:H+ antiporter subunit G